MVATASFTLEPVTVPVTGPDMCLNPPKEMSPVRSVPFWSSVSVTAALDVPLPACPVHVPATSAGGPLVRVFSSVVVAHPRATMQYSPKSTSMALIPFLLSWPYYLVDLNRFTYPAPIPTPRPIIARQVALPSHRSAQEPPARPMT